MVGERYKLLKMHGFLENNDNSDVVLHSMHLTRIIENLRFPNF